LSSRRNAKAAKCFLGKALRGLKEWENRQQSIQIRPLHTAQLKEEIGLQAPFAKEIRYDL
jgi:hypothetical protein